MFEKLLRGKVLVLITCLLLIIINSYSIFFFPPTEGWWQNYAYWYNKGFSLYQDINVAYTPLYIYFMSFLMKFSDMFIFHRMVGLLMIILTFFILYKTLILLKYSQMISILAAFTGVALSFLNVVYIVMDYPVLLNLLIVSSIYFFVKTITNCNSSSKHYFNMTIAVFFIILVFFTKQSNGLLMIFGYFTSYLYLFFIRKLHFNTLLIYSILTAIFFIFFMFVFNISLENILNLTFKNDSKGSIGTLIIRIFNKENLLLYIYSMITFLILLFLKNKLPYLQNFKYKSLENIFLKSVLVLFSSLLVIKTELIVSIVSITYLIYLAYVVLKKQEEGYLFFLLVIHLIAIILTSGISVAGVWIIFIFATARIIKNINTKFDIKIMLLILILLSAFIFLKKINNPYNWWGLSQAKISNSKYSLPFPQMKYFKVDKMTYDFFNDVKLYADESLKDDMYFYPHIPIFYMLYDTKPISNNFVQWFDVITTKNMINEISKIKQKEPSLVVILEPSWSAYKGHSELKQSKLEQVKLVELLDNYVSEGKYKLEQFSIFDNSIYGDNMQDYNKVNIRIKIINPNIFNKTIDEIGNLQIVENDLDIINIKSKNISISGVNILRHKFQKNDIIEINTMYKYLSELVKLFGIPEITETTFYSYRIYKKIN